MGSGSTGVACRNLNRNFIGIEKEDKYFQIAKDRIKDGAEAEVLKEDEGCYIVRLNNSPK
jgi:DNA modification methylase